MKYIMLSLFAAAIATTTMAQDNSNTYDNNSGVPKERFLNQIPQDDGMARVPDEQDSYNSDRTDADRINADTSLMSRRCAKECEKKSGSNARMNEQNWSRMEQPGDEFRNYKDQSNSTKKGPRGANTIQSRTKNNMDKDCEASIKYKDEGSSRLNRSESEVQSLE